MLEAWFDLADAGAQAQAAEALPVHPLPDRLDSVSPSGAGQDPPEAPADASVAVLEDTLRHGEVSPAQLAQRWAGATGAILLACILSDHGVSLEVLGRFFGVHNITVRRWLSPLAHGNWHGAVQHSQRFFSGTVAVDAKWLKVAGVWWSRFVAVDHVSGLPVHVALLPSHAFRRTLPGAAQSARGSPHSHPHRRLGGLCEGHCPRLSQRPAAVVSIACPTRRLSTTAPTGAQWQRPKAMGRQAHGALADPLEAHRAAPLGHAPQRSPRQPGSRRRDPAPGHTAPAAASRRLDLASHDLQCRRTLLGRL